MSGPYDVLVIGAGPAGYVAAIRCAQLGLRTLCIDDWVDEQGMASPGGTCLNAGCIPSKALLESSELYVMARARCAEHGIDVGQVRLDLDAMMQRKARVVATLTQGVAALFQAHGVELATGRGQLLGPGQVLFHPRKGRPRQLEARHLVLATGSVPAELPVAPLQPPWVVDSAGALAFDQVPRRLGIIGAGVIGLELGSVWRRLGAEVVLLEAQDRFLPMVDVQVARAALKAFGRQGLDIRLGARVLGCAVRRKRVEVRYQQGEETLSERFDRLVVAVGRRPNSHGLAADEARLLLDEWGFVHVDEHCRTNLPNVWAIGDLVRGPMLAHKGAEEGVRVAERIAGRAPATEAPVIPNVIYTLPEIAWAGRTEEQLQKDGVDYRAGRFPFAANGRARAIGLTEGVVKLLADARTDRILGVHMIGPQCSELIATVTTAMSYEGSAEDLALTVFAHPTLSEAVHEAALDVAGQAIHVARGKR